MALLLKQSPASTFLKWINEHPAEIIKLFERFYGICGIHYIIANEGEHIPNQIMDTIIAIVPHKKESILTAAQILGQEYEQRGIEKGIQKEKLHIGKNMLSKLYLDMRTVSQATGLSEEELRRLEKTYTKKHTIMTLAERLYQEGYIKGYLLSRIAQCAVYSASEEEDKEFKTYFLDNSKKTPLLTLLERGLIKGLEIAIRELIEKKKISEEAILEVTGLSTEELIKLRKAEKAKR